MLNMLRPAQMAANKTLNKIGLSKTQKWSVAVTKTPRRARHSTTPVNVYPVIYNHAVTKPAFAPRPSFA